MFEGFKNFIVVDGTVYCVSTVNTPDAGWETMVGSPAGFMMEVVLADAREELEDNETFTDEQLINIAVDCVSWVFWDWDLLGLTKHYKTASQAEKGHNKTMAEIVKILA